MSRVGEVRYGTESHAFHECNLIDIMSLRPCVNHCMSANKRAADELMETHLVCIPPLNSELSQRNFPLEPASLTLLPRHHPWNVTRNYFETLQKRKIARSRLMKKFSALLELQNRYRRDEMEYKTLNASCRDGKIVLQSVCVNFFMLLIRINILYLFYQHRAKVSSSWSEKEKENVGVLFTCLKEA